MKTTFDRIVMTAIAVALTVIALNPWRAGAREAITKVNIVELNGRRVDKFGGLPVELTLLSGPVLERNPLPIVVINKK